MAYEYSESSRSLSFACVRAPASPGADRVSATCPLASEHTVTIRISARGQADCLQQWSADWRTFAARCRQVAEQAICSRSGIGIAQNAAEIAQQTRRHGNDGTDQLMATTVRHGPSADQLTG